MLLYRVFPHIAGTPNGAEGGALFVPRQGEGRIDNPRQYRVCYASSHPSGAVAEVFGGRVRWSSAMLRGRPRLPGSVQALATLEIDDNALICDLDDPKELARRSLRPSRVITRDLLTTQAWAAHIHRERRFAGVTWWSYYDARWKSAGIWDASRVTLVDIEPLRLAHAAIRDAAAVLKRRIVA